MMKLTRRTVLTGLSALAATAARSEAAWPNRPITLVHGFPPGGPVDTVSRILAEGLSKRLRQQVLVDSKPGATGTIAAGQVARAAPDGYTLIALPGTFAATAAMYRNLPYRPIDDFTMISMTAEFPYVMVTHSDHSIRTLAELISLAPARAAPLQYGTAGVGSLQHLSMELFAKTAKIQLQHIPYRGGAPAITDLLGKRLDLVLDPPTALVEFINDGRLRALAVTGGSRFFSLPDIPTITEAGVPGYSVTSWQGIAAPAGLPSPLVNKLNQELRTVLTEPVIVEQLKKLGNDPRPTTSDDFKTRIAADIKLWDAVVASANIERI